MSCAAANAVTAAPGVTRARRAAAETHKSVRSRLENHRHRRPCVVARAGVHPERDGARANASSDASKSTRRDALFAFAAVAANAGFSAGTAFAEQTTTPSGDDTSARTSDPLFGSSSSPSVSDPGADPAPSAAAPPKPLPSVRYKGTNWSVICPGSYERKSTDKPRRIYEQRADCEPNCRDLQAKRTEETPLVARFGSADESQDISVSVRGANTLKLTFLQIKDVTEFGDVDEAASLFIPPGAKLLNAAERREDTSDKSYYAYDFEFGAARVLLTAAVEAGNVYLVGCTASKEAWTEAEPGFKRASSSFRVGAEATPSEKKIAAPAPAAAAAVADVDLPVANGRPAETMNCKGPLPIFCSVDAE